MPHIVNAVVLLAAWSAAAADLYISSRFLYFLSKRRHAPAFLSNLIKYPSDRRQVHDEEARENIWLDILEESPISQESSHRQPDTLMTGGVGIAPRKPFYVLPLACVLVSASFGLLTFLSIRRGSSAQLVRSLSTILHECGNND